MKFFGYNFKTLFLRIRYYFYLKYSKHLLFPNKLSNSYRKYIDVGTHETEVNREANRIYNLLRRKTEDRGKKKAIIDEFLKADLSIFNLKFRKDFKDSRSDPVSGYTWPIGQWYRDARSFLDKGTDIKRPWELSRLYFLVPLSLEYFETKDSEVFDQIYKLIEDWKKENSLATSPNWSCTMDVAIRLANLSISYVLISDNKKSRALDFQRILNDHIGFVANNLENISKITSNHFAANISGLFVALKLLPKTSNGTKLFEFVRRELENEIRKQTLEDGWNFELSSCYHRLVFEFFFYPMLISSDSEFSDEYKGILYKQVSVLNSFLKSTGEMPQIGDNDSGRFIVPERLDLLGKTYLEHDLIFYNSVLGFKDKKIIYEYDDAGIFFYNTEDLFVSFKSGRKGQSGMGGHSHNDTLSLELQYKKQDIFVDPGSGCYTSNPRIRNAFRSIKSHNSIFWDKLEESDLKQGLFLLFQENNYKHSVDQTEQFVLFSGENNYGDRWHLRKVKIYFHEDKIEIIDRVSHPHALISFNIIYPIEDLKLNSCKVGKSSWEWESTIEPRIQDNFYSPHYDKVVDSKRLVIPMDKNEHNLTIYLE